MNDLNVTINDLSDREISWIARKINIPNFHIDFCEANRSSLERYIRDSIGNEVQVIGLQANSKDYLLLDKELEWIDRDNPRLLRWMRHYCLQPASGFGVWHGNGFSSEIKTHAATFTAELDFYNTFITTFDAWHVDLSDKKMFIDKAISIWSKLLFGNNNKLNWLNKSDETQLKWIWGYLNENMPNFPYSPTDIEEMYSYIQSIYDCCEQYSKEYESLRKMKQAWAQQKYRLNLNGRKQSTFVLRAEAKEQLQEMARARNTNLDPYRQHRTVD
jgi:hypothetical protein